MKAVKVLNVINSIYLFIFGIIYLVLSVFGLLFSIASTGSTVAVYGDVSWFIYSILLVYGGILLFLDRGYKYYFVIVLTLIIMFGDQTFRFLAQGFAFRTSDMINLFFVIIPFALALIAKNISDKHKIDSGVPSTSENDISINQPLN